MKNFMVAICTLLILAGCGSVVPPGTTVILVEPSGETEVITSGAFKAWGRTRAYFVDGRLKSYPKDIKVLCSDDINMDVSLKWVGSFKVTDKTIDTIKKKVPAVKMEFEDDVVLALSLDKFFKTTMEDMLSSIARGVISEYRTDDIRPNREKIRQLVKNKFLVRMEELKYPVETADVLLTNLDFPPDVIKMRTEIKNAELQDQKNAAIAKAEVAKAKRNAELEAERGKATLVKAKIDASANKIRAKSLTPEILAVKQLETLVKLAEGPNNSVVVIPFEAIRPGGMQDMLVNRQAIEGLRK